MKPNESSPAFISERCIPEPTTGCWLWARHQNSQGYGIARVKGKLWRAHRLAYTIFRGPIPGDADVLHHCDTPACVNPAHLFLGDDQANCDDKWRKNRAVVPQGDAHGRAKLTRAIVEELRRRPAVNIRVTAYRLGVSPATLRRALIGAGWATADGPRRPVIHIQRVSAETVAAIRREFKPGVTLTSLSIRYGVSLSHVSRIVKEQTRTTAERNETK